MVKTQQRIRKMVIQLALAATASAALGAAVIAGPMTFDTVRPALQPLASGPAIQLAKAGPGEAEDCVRVTRLTAPDGREYPTNGLVCGER